MEAQGFEAWSMKCHEASASVRYVSVDVYLLVIKSSWQSLGHNIPDPRPCLFFLSISCWFVLMEHAKTLNQYTYVSTARNTANNWSDTSTTIL